MKKSKTTRKPKDATDADLIRFGISIPADLLTQFDALLSNGSSQNRSEAIRDLIRDRLVQEAWSGGKGEQVATLTVVYDNRGPEFQRRLHEAKRAFGERLISTLHTPLGTGSDLEVLALRGPATQLKAQADALLAIKGILHGKLVASSASVG